MKRRLPTLRSVSDEQKPTNAPRMTPYEALIFGAEIGDCPSVDLHHEPPDSALVLLEQFIKGELRLKTEVVRIIHGRGAGTLERLVSQWLRRHKTLIAFYRPSERIHEAGAVTYACLEHNKPKPKAKA